MFEPGSSYTGYGDPYYNYYFGTTIWTGHETVTVKHADKGSHGCCDKIQVDAAAYNGSYFHFDMDIYLLPIYKIVVYYTC